MTAVWFTADPCDDDIRSKDFNTSPGLYTGYLCAMTNICDGVPGIQHNEHS